LCFWPSAFCLVWGETVFRLSVVLAASALLIACSTYKDSPAAPSPPVSATPPAPTPTPAPSPAPPPGGSPTVTITPAGFSPLEITIGVGQRVAFLNNDTRPHDLVGGVDPQHPDCPEIVVFITPGQRSETAVFTSARTCSFHDHTALGVPGFVGRIIIQ
jgi:hypothetical protein